MHRRILASIVPLILLACARVTGGRIAEIDRTSLPPADTTLRGWMASNPAAIALGLQPLRVAVVPDGVQEIRVWSGVELGAERQLLRLVRERGRVSGSYSEYWEVPRPVRGDQPGMPGIDSIVRYSVAGLCGPFVRSGHVEACRFHLVSTPRWAAIWDSLNRRDLWTLPDQSTLSREGIIGADGWSMTVELRDGPYYRSYAYSNPDWYKDSRQVAAAALARAVRSVNLKLATPLHDRVVRGRLDMRRARFEFTPCGASSLWSVAGVWGRPEVDSIMRTIPAGDTTTRRTAYAELRGMPSLPALRARPGFPDFEVDSVVKIEAWDGIRCGGVHDSRLHGIR